MGRASIPASFPPNNLTMKCMKICVDKFIHAPKGLRLPPKFTRSVGGGFPNRVVLHNCVGSSWTVLTGFDYDGTILLRDGWAKFRDENRVRHQDICVFHYDGEGSFHVIVFGKNALQKMPPTDQGHSDGYVNCNKRFFKVYFEKNLVHPVSEMALPPMWRHRLFTPCPGSVQLVNKFGVPWVVEFKVNSSGCFVLSTGFQQFIVQNGITVGEFMFFNVVGDGVLRVDIFETSYYEKNDIVHAPLPHHIIEISDEDDSEREMPVDVRNVKTEHGIGDERGECLDAEDSGISKNVDETGHTPFVEGEGPADVAMDVDIGVETANVVHPDAFPSYNLLIKQSYFDTPRLPIPMQFWTTHISGQKVVRKRVDLMMNGGTWSVGLNRQASRVAMRHHIRRFLQDNSIVVGTMCVLELAPTNHLSFNVRVAE